MVDKYEEFQCTMAKRGARRILASGGAPGHRGPRVGAPCP